MNERQSSITPNQGFWCEAAAVGAVTMLVSSLCVSCGELLTEVSEVPDADADTLAATRACSSKIKHRCCGNSVCEAGESCSTCASDCGACAPVCGDGTCADGESCSSCPADCGACGPVCGDGRCEVGETCDGCGQDCGACANNQPIPGRIEAEDFDDGGEGVGYHDTTVGNTLAAYRDTDVDVGTCSEGGYRVGYVFPGEWLRYSLAVAADGDFTLAIRYATTADAQIHVELDGAPLGNAIALPSTASWFTYASVATRLSLSAGAHELTIVDDAGNVDFNYFDFAAAGACVAEDDAAFCAARCGAITAPDNCGVTRAVDCGSCGDEGAAVADVGTGATFRPSYLSSITGGGAMPSLVGAVTAACAGDGVTDDTSCLQSAANMARSQGKPLAVPFTGAFYRITSPLTIYGSVIGTGGMPTIKQTSTCTSASCAGLRLAAGMSGWVYNLHLVGTRSATSRGEFAHNINLGGVNGVTIKGNLLENPAGDCVADNAQELDGAAAARNVLIDGNTMINPGRCMVSLVNVSDGWAVMNNVMSDDVAYVSPIDLEPWRAASHITNVEVGYNEVTTPANAYETSLGNYVGVVTASGWFDPTPGANVYVHHNYGSWPFTRFVKVASNAGAFTNVVDVSNVEGSSPAP